MPDIKQGGDTPFLTDVKTLRETARQHIQAGAVTSNYGADPNVVCKVLNEALATEIVCVLRYKRHYFMAQGIASDSVKTEFAEHATQEQEHADRIAERIGVCAACCYHGFPSAAGVVSGDARIVTGGVLVSTGVSKQRGACRGAC